MTVVTRPRILVVDDDEAIRSVMLDGLEELYDCSVAVAHNGEAGLRLMTESRPDVLLLDLMMPGLDGFGVLMRLRDFPEEARPGRVIVMSGLSDVRTRSSLLEMGASAILPKPFSLDDLDAAICLPLRR